MAPIAIGIVSEVVNAGAAFSSPYEFHVLQSGQRPSHFGDWLPHSVHEKTAAVRLAKCGRL